MSSRSWRGTALSITVLAALTVSVPGSAQSPTREQLAEQVVNWLASTAAVPQSDVGTLEPFSPGWLEEFEIRTETDRFDFDRQRYALRGEPKLPHVRRAEKRLQQVQRESLASLTEEAQRDADGSLLELLFGLATDVRERQLVDSLIAVQRRLVAATRSRLAEPDYDIEKVLDAEEGLDDLLLRAEELDNRARRVLAPIPVARIVGLQDIRARLERLAAAGPSPLATDPDLALIDAELGLERAENLEFIQFFQVEYRGARDLINEQVSVGTSIALPRRQDNIRDIDELKIERLEAEYEAEIDAREVRRDFDADLLELRLLFDKYDALAASFERRADKRERLGRVYLANAMTRPEALLRLERRNLRDRLDLLNLEEDIREAWAELIGDYVVLDAQAIAAWVVF